VLSIVYIEPARGLPHDHLLQSRNMEERDLKGLLSICSCEPNRINFKTRNALSVDKAIPPDGLLFQEPTDRNLYIV